MLCLDDGTLIATCDRRKADEGDLPHDIDVVMIRSCDNGATWSKPVTIAEGKGLGKGYGDAALVQCADGEVICTFAGAAGFWESTEENPIRTYVCRSADRGITWSEPEDITSTLWGSLAVQSQARDYRGSFNASGNGLRLTKGRHKGRIMFVAAIGLIVRSAIGPVERLLNMLGHQNMCALAYALAFLVNLVLCVLLVPRFGGYGAAAATSIALVFETILLFWITRNRLGFHVLAFGKKALST